MSQPLVMDLLDRKIAHALQVDGRAPFSAIAGVLDVSDQTVARRYHKLRTAGALRVLGLADAHRLGQVDWLVRLRCVPDAAAPLAAALARRGDTSWVSLTSGGTEIACFTRAPLLDKLPRTPRVVAVSAHCLLHTFFGGPAGWSGRTDVLTPHQIQRLSPTPAVPGDEPVEPAAGDAEILAELARDGRTGYPRLAEAAGCSPATALRRVEFLRRTGALYFDVDVDPELFGFPCQAMLWLAVPPSHLDAAGAELAGHPEVAFAAATTGPTNIVAFVACRDVAALYRYVATRLGAIQAVRDVETAPVIRMVKRAGSPLAG